MGADEWDDPHDLIPEQFREEFGDSETVADALRRAELRESSTSDSERRCCPECYSVQVSPKAPSMYSEQRQNGAWKCESCYEHFDEPLNMNPNATAFEWIEPDELPDADARERLTPSLDVDRETAVRYALLLRAPWRDAEPLSYPEIAAALPFSNSWVGARVREWRDGEHRELVPDPTADEIATQHPGKSSTKSEAGVAENATSVATVDDAPAASSGAVATDGGRRRRWDAFGSD